MSSARERRPCDIRPVGRSAGRSRGVHLRVGQHAAAADRRQPRRRRGPAASFRHGHIPGSRTPGQGVQGPNQLPELDEDRDRVRRRRR